MEMGTLWGRIIPDGASLPRNPSKTRNEDLQGHSTSLRSHGDSIQEAINEVPGWTVALHTGPVGLQAAVAPFYYHVMSIRSIHFHSRPAGRRLHKSLG